MCKCRDLSGGFPGYLGLVGIFCCWQVSPPTTTRPFFSFFLLALECLVWVYLAPKRGPSIYSSSERKRIRPPRLLTSCCMCSASIRYDMGNQVCGRVFVVYSIGRGEKKDEPCFWYHPASRMKLPMAVTFHRTLETCWASSVRARNSAMICARQKHAPRIVCSLGWAISVRGRGGGRGGLLRSEKVMCSDVNLEFMSTA